MSAKISILIHNLNRAAILERCLASVGAAAYRPLEVLVLDAGSDDGSQAIIAAALARMNAAGIEARFLPCPPMGCPASRNLAAAQATGDLLFFMDNDATLTPDSDLGAIARMFGERPSLAIVSFRILLEDSSAIDPFAWVFRRPREAWRDRAFTTFTFAGAGFCARASAYRTLGGFWERLIYSREEEELSYGLISAGWQIVYSPAVTLRHYPSARGRAEVAKRRRIELINGTLVLWRRLPAIAAVAAIAGRMISMSAKTLLRDPGATPGLLAAAADAGRQVLFFGEPRHPIRFADLWRVLRLHGQDA
jgi:GT2 family glycosyltransferase